MLSKYTNLFFPICSLVNAILVFIVFFTKKKVKNDETKIYSKLVICGLIEALLYTFICLIAHFYLNNSTIIYFVILNKILYIVYIIWFTILFIYTLIFFKFSDKKKIKRVFYVIDIILIILIIVSKVEIYYNPVTGFSNSDGAAANILYFGIGFYILVIFALIMVNIENISSKRKFIPFFVLICLMMIAMIIRVVDPFFSISSNVLSLIVLIMYFTIENPDLKMLNELNRISNLTDKISEEKTDISYKMHETVKEALIKIKQKNNLARETDGAYKKQIESEIDEYINEQLSVIDGYVNILPTDKMHIKISSNKYNLYSFIKKIEKTIVSYNVNNIEFKIAYVEYLPKYLLGDYIHLKQVIMSILINELRITKFGSIKVNFNGVTSYDLCKLMITIENSGRNMEIEEINNILNQEINYEDDYDYSTLNKLNIDLPTTFKIIKMLGGTMNITSNKESGTKINIILNQKIADVPLLNDESLTIKNKKVLVIDDDIGEKNKIRNILNKLGYSVETSLYEEDAIYKIINKNKYDVIIIDDYLTSTSADIVLKKICNYDTNSKKIILLAEKNFDKVNYYLKKGFTTYIKKDNLKEELNKVDKLIKSGK